MNLAEKKPPTDNWGAKPKPTSAFRRKNCAPDGSAVRRLILSLVVTVIGLTLSQRCEAQRASTSPEQIPFRAPDGWAYPAEHFAAKRGDHGMVGTTDRVASEIGAEMLRRGGNAVDAAVAVHFALAVVNPEAGNIGGGGFMVLRTTDGETAALDFREKAPLVASRDMFLDEVGELTDRSRVGQLASGVPGSVAGMWEAHQRFGSLPWAELLAPAIHCADGVIVHQRLARSLEKYATSLQRFPSTASVFLPLGRAPRVGERFVQQDLAATLRRIARDGVDGFYRGITAELIEAEMQRGGGVITREDLRRYQAVWRDPIVFGYRNHSIIAMPPPSSGGVALAEMLNILEGYDLVALRMHSRDHIHVWAEAAKRAFVDRNAYLADPDFVLLPVERLVSDAYARVRRAEIDGNRATPSEQVLPGLTGDSLDELRDGQDTTHYSIIDNDGNAVAVTTTINSLYGSLVTVSGAGFLLNNEMDDFAARPGTPNQFGLVEGAQNAIEPEKRMLSSMCPVILLDAEGDVKLITGSPGGPTIITTVAQIISNIVDFEMDVAAATAAPRLHHQHLPDVLYFELNGLDDDVISELQTLGHELEERSGFQGDTQSILVTPGDALSAAADPRRGGAAVSVDPASESR